MKNDFLKNKILPSLLRFALPLMLSLLLQSLYGAADLIVVGQFGSTASVSAVATGSQLMVAVTAIVTGLTMGVTVVIGQAVGANETERAGNAVCAMIKTFTVLALVLTAVLAALAYPLACLLNAPQAALKQTESYIRICGCGMIFITAYNAVSGVFRGIGNSKTPFLFVAFACLINIALDLLFVAGLGMDASGAALATIIAQASSVVFSLIYLKHKKLPFSVNKIGFSAKGSVREILAVGTPIALQDFLVSISFLIITAIVNTLGLDQSAGVGIAEKLFVFLSIVPMSFLSAISAFVAQNVGGGRYDRAKKALFLAICVSFCFGAAMFFFTFFGGRAAARIFTADSAVITQTAMYFKSCSFEYLIISVSFCMLGYFNGMKKTVFVMIQGLISAFAVRIPLSLLFSNLPDADMTLIGIAVPVSAAVSLAMCLTYFLILQRKSHKTEEKI